MVTKLYGTPILPTLSSELRKLDAEIFHANFPSPYVAFTVSVAGTLRRIPSVLTWHNDLPPVTSGARALIETHDHIVLPLYLRGYKRVIATSRNYAQRSRILTKYRSLVTVVENGVDCRRFHPSTNGMRIREQLGLRGVFLLIFVGALTKWHRYKGLDILLRAMKILGSTGVMLLVVGDGDLKQSYCQMSRQLNVSDRVRFVGDVSDRQLPEYYAASDVLVLPSKDMSEGFGLTLLEANATGKACIASNVGGIPAVIKNGHNGFLVPPNDPESIARAVADLANDRRRLCDMGRNGRRIALLHDWKVVACQTEHVYEKALSSRAIK